MNKYTLKVQKKNRPKSAYPVQLKHYMIISDDAAGKCFALIKLFNETNYLIDSIHFNIIQSNKSDGLLASTKFELNNIAIPRNAEYVPTSKFEVDPKCDMISFTLTKALTNDMKWVNQRWLAQGENEVPEEEIANDVVALRVVYKKLHYPILHSVVFAILFIVLSMSVIYIINT